MKKLVLLFAALVLASCNNEEPDGKSLAQLQHRGVNGYFEKNGTVAYTGKAYEKHTRPGFTHRYRQKGYLFEGFRDGAWEVWFEDGQLEEAGNYEGGKKSGTWTYWHRNGNKSSEGTYIDGKRDGPWTTWHLNGQKREEKNYKNGELDDSWTSWHENGQKVSEGTFKDGKPDGPIISWHENGQKSVEGIFKDGELISGKYWNSKGEEVDSQEEAFK